MFACEGYFYAGKRINIREKVRSVAKQVRSIELIVWVSVLEDPKAVGPKEADWGDWPSDSSRSINFEQLAFDLSLIHI